MGYADDDAEIQAKAKEWIDAYGVEFLVELIGDYLSDAGERLARLRQAADDGDIDLVTLEAHTLRSSSANLGAVAFAERARQIEHAALAGQVAEAVTGAANIGAMFEDVRVALENVRVQALEKGLLKP